jgi:hypothetical protein
MQGNGNHAKDGGWIVSLDTVQVVMDIIIVSLDTVKYSLNMIKVSLGISLLTHLGYCKSLTRHDNRLTRHDNRLPKNRKTRDSQDMVIK